MVEKVFWTIEERLKEELDSPNEYQFNNHTLLEKRLKTFWSNPKWDSFSDLKLCNALETTLDKILVNVTHQRRLSFIWILRLLEKFESVSLKPLMVYECIERPGHYVVCDGQHTATVLYLLITRVFKENIKDCIIPIMIYDAAQVKELYGSSEE